MIFPKHARGYHILYIFKGSSCLITHSLTSTHSHRQSHPNNALDSLMQIVPFAASSLARSLSSRYHKCYFMVILFNCQSFLLLFVWNCAPLVSPRMSSAGRDKKGKKKIRKSALSLKWKVIRSLSLVSHQ